MQERRVYLALMELAQLGLAEEAQTRRGRRVVLSEKGHALANRLRTYQPLSLLWAVEEMSHPSIMRRR